MLYSFFQERHDGHIGRLGNDETIFGFYIGYCCCSLRSEKVIHKLPGTCLEPGHPVIAA